MPSLEDRFPRFPFTPFPVPLFPVFTIFHLPFTIHQSHAIQASFELST
jgi:hypothetical protein